MKQRLAAILAADAAGYSRLMSLDDRGTVAALDSARLVFRSQIEANGGRVVDMAGDSVMAIFLTAFGAVTAAMAVQAQLKASAQALPEGRRMRFRIGVHLGDVIEKSDGTIYGDGVNIAARLEAMGEPGGVVVSASIRTAVKGRIATGFEDFGEQAVKNFVDPIRVYRLQSTGQTCGDQAPAISSTASPTAFPTNLPAELPPLFGRVEELAALQAILESQRLVTVVGAGGIGKTSLAQALAHRLRHDFDAGTWLIPLAPITDPSLVVTAVASVLQLSLPGIATSQALAKAVGERRMLIVLDNCEHLLEPVGALAAALHRDAPHVQVLATSQEPLKIAEEHLLRLGSLAVPAEAGAESARRAGAVALFEARAKAADPRFALTEDNVDAVVDICRRLDGIALAIELAAARVQILGVQGLRARLDERFRVLTGGARLALRRHQTLRAAMEWSHSLLTPAEQTVFRRLGVFVGSFGLASAMRVAGDESIDEWGALDHLGALVDKSLVMPETGQDPRYRLLETSRAFAFDKLHEAGETEAMLRRHAEATLAVFEAAHEDEWVSTAQARLDRYLPDLDNGRAALDWSDADAGELHTALAAAMAWIWYDAALRPEGLRRTRHALRKIDSTTSPRLEARLLGSWSTLAFPQTGAEELAANERAVHLWRAVGTPRELCEALCAQAIPLAYRRRFDEAESALQEAGGLIDEAGPAAARIPLLRSRYTLARLKGDFELGLAVAEENFRLCAAVDDARRSLRAMISQELCLASLGRLEESEALGREMQSRMQRNPSLCSGNENIVLSNLCFTLTRLGKIDEALEMGRLVAPLVARMGRLYDLLDAFSNLAFRRGHETDAARLIGCADRRFATGTVAREAVEQGMRDETLVQLGSVLDAEALTRLRKEGEALSDDEAVRLALRDPGLHRDTLARDRSPAA